jgi:hypothetical protein
LQHLHAVRLYQAKISINPQCYLLPARQKSQVVRILSKASHRVVRWGLVELISPICLLTHHVQESPRGDVLLLALPPLGLLEGLKHGHVPLLAGDVCGQRGGMSE